MPKITDEITVAFVNSMVFLSQGRSLLLLVLIVLLQVIKNFIVRLETFCNSHFLFGH